MSDLSIKIRSIIREELEMYMNKALPILIESAINASQQVSNTSMKEYSKVKYSQDKKTLPESVKKSVKTTSKSKINPTLAQLLEETKGFSAEEKSLYSTLEDDTEFVSPLSKQPSKQNLDPIEALMTRKNYKAILDKSKEISSNGV